MKFKFTLLFASLLAVQLCFGQSFIRCTTMEHHEMLVNQGLAPANQLDQLDQLIQQWINNNPENSSTLITIPVVFHVIYNTTAQNISDARIMAQLDVLNKDYARLNADSVNTPSIFHSVAANTEIQFCLATQDPSGNATTGITRTQTNLSGFQYNGSTSPQPMKFTAQGGHDIWNRNHYLNVWIVNFTDWTLGYAQFPGSGTASTDGVVVDYRSVGGPGAPGTSAPYHLGRTATHEIGHWLGLYHTFQGGCAGTSPTTCANPGGGDQICDTPPTSSSNFGCPNNQNTCTETPTNQPDMVTNYMDYTDDPCMNIFTQGQKTRMQGALNTSRNSILSSPGCLPVGISSEEALNAGINLFPNPSSGLFTLQTSFQEDTELNVFVYNVLGEKILQSENKNLLRNKLELDLNNYSNGIYYIVFEANGYTTSRRVSISR